MTDSGPRLTLQTVLAFDAATCALMGALLALASGPIAGLTAILGLLLLVAGLLLLPIAVFMAMFARAATIPAWAAQVIVGGNLLWVLASVLPPVFGLIAPNGLGWLFLLMQAAVVAVFAGFEWTLRGRSAVA